METVTSLSPGETVELLGKVVHSSGRVAFFHLLLRNRGALMAMHSRYDLIVFEMGE